VAPLEPWEKVLVDEDFLETAHGEYSCIDCHLGEQDGDKSLAHVAMVSRPSEENLALCGECHDEAENFEDSLHISQAGYMSDMAARGVDVESPEIQEMFGNHCQSCHTSCGDCHVSQPSSVGGGFIDGHLFKKTPSMTRNCTACHGSRVGKEYMGQHEDILADVHFRQERMVCVDCHTGMSMHDSSASCETCHDDAMLSESIPVDHRYSGGQDPACADCHPQTISEETNNMYHLQHSENLSCQVCHSINYNNCDGCHVSVSETSGNPIFSTEGSYLTFLIGKNPIQDAHRPYDYTVVRHIPVDPESFAFYGENLMPDFNAVPTWQYATPHNIQLETPQNASCDGCHNNPDFFLTIDKIAPEEVDANLGVYLESLP
jgi:hypothetical protein